MTECQDSDLVSSGMQVVCDGEPLELPDDIEGVLILNIHSYMGGVDLWASGVNSTVGGKTGKQSLCDGMLEVALRCKAAQ